MAEQLTIRITAQDGASRVFTAVGNGATKMGDALERAGKEGKQAFDDLGRSAEQNSQRMERARAEATAIGAVMGTLTSAVIAAGTAYRDQERQIDGINRLFGDQATVILDMTERIQDFTRYSNDAARESTLLASSLISNYDLSADQLAILIERSADLAQIYGFDLPDAVQRTAGAIRGEGEAAERLGLNMSDAAIAARALEAGITNWGVPGALSEAEKAAFRFQVFLEDTEATVGAAADAADSAGGSFRQLANTFQDGVAAAGGFLGPIGEIGAELAPIAIAAPVVGAGLGRLATSLRGSALAAGALGLALNPITLTLGAIVGIGSLVVGSWLDQKAAAEEYDATLQSLGDTMEDVRRRGDEELAGMLDDATTNVDEARKRIEEALNFDEFYQSMAEQEDFPVPGTEGYDRIQEKFFALQDTLNDAGWEDNTAQRALNAFDDAMDDANVDIEEYLGWANKLISEAALTPGLEDDIAALDEIGDTIDRMPAEFLIDTSQTEANIEAVKASAVELEDIFTELPTRLDDLRIGGEGQLADDIEGLHENIVDAFTVSEQEVAAANSTWLRMLPAEDAQAALDEMTSKTELTVETTEALGTAWERISDQMASGNLDSAALMEDINAILQDTTLSAEEQALAIIDLSQNLSQYGDVVGRVAEQFGELHESGVAALTELAQAAKQAEHDFIASGLAIAGWDDALSQINMTSIASDTSRLAEATGIANTALENTFRIVVEGSNAIGANTQAVEDWIVALTTAEDGWTAIDQLLADRVIDENEYNAALEAQSDILAANALVQQEILAIQTAQAPLLANLTEQQASYVAEIGRLPAQQQLIALGWMDAATAAQVMEVQSLAAAAATGEMGEAGYELTQRFVEGAVAANPVLEQLLTDIGLVARDHEGNLVINFSGAEGAKSEIELLTESIVQLTDLLDDGVINGSVQIESDQAQGAVDDIVRELEWMEANGEIDVPITADAEGALGALQGVRDDLDALDGSTAEVSVSAQLAGLSGAASGLLGFARGEDINVALGIPESIDVPVTVSIQGGAGVGDGTGGATNFRDVLGVPEEVVTNVAVSTTGTEDVETLKSVIDETAGESTTVSIAANVTGFDEIGSLYDILRNLEGSTRTVTIDVQADTSDIDSALLSLGIGGEGGAAGFDNPTVYVTFEADTSEIDTWTPPEISPVEVAITGNAGGPDGAATVISDLVVGGKEPLDVSIDITANDTASATLATVTAAAAAIPESESVTVVALADGAINALNNVTAAAGGIPESESVTVSVFGAGDAVSALNSVANAAANIPGSVSTTVTTFRDTVYRTFGSSSGFGPTSMHGGIPELAHGGVTARMGEAGPEQLHFANGGTAWAPIDALYQVPQMTYVSPANASGPMGGHTFNITVHGSNAAEIRAVFTDEIMPALIDVVEGNDRAYGGAR